MYTRPPVEIHRLYYFLCWWPIWFSASWKCVKITWFCSLEPGKDVVSQINGSLSKILYLFFRWIMVQQWFLDFCSSSMFIANYRVCFVRKLTQPRNIFIHVFMKSKHSYLITNYSKSFNTIIGWCLVQFSFIYAYQSEVFSSIGICYLEVYVS